MPVPSLHDAGSPVDAQVDEQEVHRVREPPGVPTTRSTHHGTHQRNTGIAPNCSFASVVKRPPCAFKLKYGSLTICDHLTRITAQRVQLQAPSKASDIRYELSSPNVSDKPFIVGVAGGTSSGKTTIAERLADSMGAHELALVKLDSYYISRTEQPMEERAAANYDHPSAFDWDLLNQHLNELLNWRPAPVPTYDYTIHDRTDIVDVVQPARIVVVEGILVLWNTELRNQFDLKVFVDTPADLRFIRRLERDVVERGRTQESIISQYLATVRPSHEDFIEPSRAHADVIIPEGGLNRPALDVLMARVREIVN